MNSNVIGFIGFGEAAYFISSGLIKENSIKIIAYDVNQNHPLLGEKIIERAKELGILLMPSFQGLLEESNIIISATSAKYALAIAEEALPYLNKEKLFIDINAASPMIKEEISALVVDKVNFVDAAVMESIPNFKHKVPLLVSGIGAKAFEAIGNELGMDITFIDHKPSSASAIKMMRSIFMKGITMLLMETLSASEKLGVTDIVLESLDKSLRDKKLKVTADLLITRTATHAARRVTEMEDVIKTLENLQVDSLLSQATKEKLITITDANLNEYFNHKSPSNYLEVIKRMTAIFNAN